MKRYLRKKRKNVIDTTTVRYREAELACVLWADSVTGRRTCQTGKTTGGAEGITVLEGRDGTSTK